MIYGVWPRFCELILLKVLKLWKHQRIYKRDCVKFSGKVQYFNTHYSRGDPTKSASLHLCCPCRDTWLDLYLKQYWGPIALSKSIFFGVLGCRTFEATGVCVWWFSCNGSCIRIKVNKAPWFLNTMTWDWGWPLISVGYCYNRDWSSSVTMFLTMKPSPGVIFNIKKRLYLPSFTFNPLYKSLLYTMRSEKTCGGHLLFPSSASFSLPWKPP